VTVKGNIRRPCTQKKWDESENNIFDKEIELSHYDEVKNKETNLVNVVTYFVSNSYVNGWCIKTFDGICISWEEDFVHNWCDNVRCGDNDNRYDIRCEKNTEVARKVLEIMEWDNCKICYFIS